MVRVGTLLFSLLMAGTAHGQAVIREAKGVLVVDVVSFPPALEKAHARQRMWSSVLATVMQHGWEPVLSETCHDFTCVGPAAAATPENYALILTATLTSAGDAMNGTDVAVSLWRDGAVIARFTEEDEKAEADKTPGGLFLACGPPNGVCVAPLLISKLQQYTARLLEAENVAIQNRAAAAASSVKLPPTAAAPPATPAGLATTSAPSTVPSSRGGGIVGWSVAGIGVAALATGISLWALDGHASGKCAGTEPVCDVYDTRTPGVVLTVVGAAGIAAGGLLVWRAESARSPQVVMGLGSLLVSGRF